MADMKLITADPPPPTNTDDDSALSVPPFDTAFFTQGDSQNVVAVITADPPPPTTTDYDSALSVPPFDTAFFTQGDSQNGAAVDDLDFDFSFDDLYIPTADELNDLFNPTQVQEFGSQYANFSQLELIVDQFQSVSNSNSLELRCVSGDVDHLGDRSSNGSYVLYSALPGLEAQQISDHLNEPSPESNGSYHEGSQNCGGVAKISNWPSPESQGSGNCGSNVYEDSNNFVIRSVSCTHNLNNRSTKIGGVDQKVKLKDPSKNKVNGSLLKRKKDCEDLPSIKCRKSISNDAENSNDNNNNGGLSEEDDKRKAKLMRNRESAQLSRQRRKQYVEELEEKVRSMHSTIQDLNMKISYFMTENVTLRQQVGGSGAIPPPSMAPHMYPYMYPWMPYAPPYVMKQGSQVPLVPIPRLKPQQFVQAPKARKKTDNKKNGGPKTKKVASVSFLGLLFFIMLFGGLVPMFNVRYGGVRYALSGGESYVRGGFYEKHHQGRVLMVNGTVPGDKYVDRRDSSSKPNPDEFVRSGNESEPLVASLYVPRSDKLVKIDGNLIIHSVLASERAISSHGETGLAVPGVQSSGGRKPNATDGSVQQWFREGLAGPMLSSGTCTEVFQFDVSTASTSGAIVPATTTTRNVSSEQSRNSTHLIKGRNRRILHNLPVPVSESSLNISTQQHTRRNSQEDNFSRNNHSTVSPMVVSVLVDPREVGDGDVDGVMGAKSLSRIFVVLLIDSVKYVTYSCVVPLKGSGW